MLGASNKRIAKNTVFLYVRTLLVMLVALYTSRLVLHVLGETDLGIYNLVGGVVTMMAFLQSAQTKATSRFITFDLGSSPTLASQKKIFSLCMTMHIILALIIVFIAETVGLWMINYWTEIPSERMFAANVVYQFSVLTFIIHFLRVPFDSVIIAHENMSIYAYMSIIEVILQLGVVLIVSNLFCDSLILYGSLVMSVALILFLLYAAYVRQKYRAYRFSWLWSKEKSLEIMKFSGWALFGSSANIATQQGSSLLFNNFVGLVANTALGFANQVNSAVTRFVSSFTTAFNPQIVKLYAQGDYESLHLLMTRSAKFSFVLCYLFALPLIVNMDFVLNLWLGTVPMYTKEFCQLILICSLIDVTTGIYNTSVTATGVIKNYQICIALSFILDLILAATLLILRFHPALVFGSRIMTRGIVNMVIGMYFGNHLVKYFWKTFLNDVIFPIILVIIITIPVVLLFSYISEGWIQLVVTTLISVLLLLFLTFYIIMTKNERYISLAFLKSKLSFSTKLSINK